MVHESWTDVDCLRWTLRDNVVYFRLEFLEFHGTLEKSDSPVAYPRNDILFESHTPSDTLIVICENNLNGSCAAPESHGELSISGLDDDLRQDYSVTLGKTCTNDRGCPDRTENPDRPDK